MIKIKFRSAKIVSTRVLCHVFSGIIAVMLYSAVKIGIGLYRGAGIQWRAESPGRKAAPIISALFCAAALFAVRNWFQQQVI